MDLRRIGYFVAVVDHGGFGAAARALYVAQPSLSQAVARLEADLGVKLLDRSHGGVEPTDAGRDFLVHAREVLDRVADVEAASDRLRTDRARELRIATLGTLAIDPLPELVRAVRSELPAVAVRVDTARSREALVAAVRRGDADAGLTDLARSGPGLSTVPIVDQEIVLVTPEQLDLGPRVTVGDLSDLAMVAPPSDVDDVARTRHAFRGHRLRVVVECPDWNGVIQAVRSGIGAVLMARPVASTFFAPGQLVSVDPPIVRAVGVVHRSDDTLPTVAALVEAARSMNARATGVSSDGSNTTT